MQPSEADQARADLEQWAQEAHENVLGIADMLNVPAEQYEQDVLILIGPLQDYVSRLPLDEFEQDDWVTLHSDLAAYVADVGIHEHGASWKVRDDETSPSGFRYVIEGAALDGETSSVDPFDVVMEEFGNLPIQIARMLANAEVAIGANSLT
ncbi:hypothetical protein ACGH2B_12095 [Streptomyces sp. BBFR2]|uniref:hypothetical protein n=1 Tax=Streptomyces sp. BBFR2 TaxID=3372854 RepID=UPI0037D99657